MYSDFTVPDNFPWAYGEPNGGEVTALTESGALYDYSVDQKIPSICQFGKALKNNH